MFESWRSFWIFERSVRSELRYHLSDKSIAFLEEVKKTSISRRRTIPKGSIFWRAQRGHDWMVEGEGDESFEIPAPHNSARMAPRPGFATEGRVNPKGIPCLYLATDKKTAIGETRPWVGVSVSVSQFMVVREVEVVDCSVGHPIKLNWYLEEPKEEEREQAVWAQIDHAYSAPVTLNDDVADYAPTQIISEAFKRDGMDGVVYKSGLGEGFNIALFDIDVAEPINCALCDIVKVEFDILDTAQPWFSRKHYETKNDA